MNRLPMRLLLTVLLHASVATSHARSLDQAEADHLRAQVGELVALIQQGDAEALLERTHPAVYKLAGSREAFEDATRVTTGQIRSSHIRTLDLVIGEPSPLYTAGDEEVCFVPRIALMEIQGRKLRSSTFMIAVRPLAGGDWQFLDGAGLRRRSQYIYRLLPKLPPGIPIPANQVQVVEPPGADQDG